jgi:hypothetical protein
MLATWHYIQEVCAVRAHSGVTSADHHQASADRRHMPINSVTTAICLFGTEHVCPKNVWCLAVLATRGFMPGYLAERNVYQRVGFYMTSDPT